ncbi:MAG: dihydroxyacetone kinase subunit L [Alkalibacterium sp.]|nr:dihydroxyacetone kinase subunit L [Alkalibacterium sp.]
MSTTEKWISWISQFTDQIIEHKADLNQLDSAIGDGDHGSNMDRGVKAVKEKIDQGDYEELTDLFKDIGMSLVSKVGGASGPLYGSAFISMAKASKETDDPSLLLEAGLDGITKRGKADPGEKTMVDVWHPVVDSLKKGTLAQSDIDEALESTKDMKATKGRASYLGDRSIGHIDPGAQSSAYLFSTLLEAGVLDD